MKKIAILGLSSLLVLSSLFVSCDSVKNANNTQKGAGIGVVAGGIIGGILGNNLGKGGNAALGAAIGAAVGGGTGALIGNKMDKQAREIDQALPGADVERIGEGIHLTLNENAVRFDTNKSTLTAGAKANLDKLVPVFKEYGDTNIEIFGYTDNTGKPEYNLTLSGQRAASVKTYLISKGISSGRFKTSGLGIADPIASNDTAEGRTQNRRVEFAITANDKMVNDAKAEAGK
ncbi:OmpA family protein [Flavobacterium sp. Fl-77]|uniref:OmpA family protein n=1 Tax=Flavobacterium flavipigmentatum TaxID=2893884 RepID=A0AAJ2VY09_9FLAO|nr:MULTISPECIES: OmpA family protein [unclassified Flavobacterium]MDX6182283.1 OmpA family protein [Flavobacterium sp. Fl-33]MDX6185804.1 OmpA family protein [Flavobacterium sp. Fl-77]UFH38984.1 OmpA family protein [Flavobacterium sp. F-70]